MEFSVNRITKNSKQIIINLAHDGVGVARLQVYRPDIIPDKTTLLKAKKVKVTSDE